MLVGRSFRYKLVLNTRIRDDLFFSRFCVENKLAPPPGVRIQSRKSWGVYLEGLGRFTGAILGVKHENALNVATQRVLQKMHGWIGFCPEMSMEEAIERILWTSKGSSVGSRYNWWGMSKGEVLTNPEFVESLPSRIAQMSGVRNPYTASLKDELRDVVMGESKAARLFLPVDLVVLVAQVMCYGVMNDRLSDYECPGSCAKFLRGGADRLVRRLCKHRFWGEGDAHKFDSKQGYTLRECVLRVMSALSEDSEIRAKVNQMSRRPVVHFPDGNLWELPGGNPSGGFMTKLMNTILTLIVLEYASIRFAETFGCEPESEVGAEGDDYIYSTDEVRFSPEWIRACGQELGLDYDANPLVEEEMTTTRLSKSSFCQRRYRLVRNGRNLVAITESDPTRMWGALLANRSSDPVVSKGIAHSLLVEHYWNESSRKLLRRYMRWLDTEFGTRSKELTDRQIEKLHVSALELHARDPISLLALENGSSKGGGWNQWTLNATAGFNSPSRAVENKRNMAKTKKRAAARAQRSAGRGGAQSATERKLLGQQIPAAYGPMTNVPMPKMKSIPGGICVSHIEPLASVSGNGNLAVRAVIPGHLAWLWQQAQDFERIKFNKWVAKYVPEGTIDNGAYVTIAPIYDAGAVDMYQLQSAVEPNFADGLLKRRFGAKTFAGWAENSVAWLAKHATRQLFRMTGGLSAPTSDYAGMLKQQADESVVPGYIAWVGTLPTGASTVIGEIFIEYEVELTNPAPAGLRGLSVASASTGGEALLLATPSGVTGDLMSYTLAGNRIHFNRAGFYTVIIMQEGTSIVMDNDGHTIYDEAANDVTTKRLLPDYDLTTSLYSGHTTTTQPMVSASGSTSQIQVLSLNLKSGDYIAIDDNTSGTLAKTYIQVLPCAINQLDHS